MRSNMKRAIALYKATQMLDEVNALVQKTLGASDDCYLIHCSIENIQDTLEMFAEQLEEMQVTE